MGLSDYIRQRLFGDYLSKAEAELRKKYGEDMYAQILKNLGQGNPAYMQDNVEQYIKDGYLFNPTVYSIISFIAQKAGTIPWGVYNVKDEKSLKGYKAGGNEITVQKMLMHKKALEEIEGHELQEVFKNPNPLQGWAEFIEQVVGFKMVTGNSYVHAIGPDAGENKGKVKEMWCLPSQIVEILAGNRFDPVKGYRMLTDRSVVIPPEQIIHLKYWTPEYEAASFLYGVSPIRSSRRVVTKSNSSYDSAVSSFQNMGAIGFVSANPNQYQNPLTPDQISELEDKYAQKTGARHRGRPLFTSVDLKWQQTGMSPVDLGIIESDKMDLRTLCNVFHVPSEMFNDAANKTYANTKEASRAILVNAVIPALTQFRDSFNRFIASRYPENIYVDFDLTVIPELQEDLQMMVQQLSAAWWITPNERRVLMGWGEDPQPQMNDYWIPAGLIQLNGELSDAQITEVEKRLKIGDYAAQR